MHRITTSIIHIQNAYQTDFDAIPHIVSLLMYRMFFYSSIADMIYNLHPMWGVYKELFICITNTIVAVTYHATHTMMTSQILLFSLLTAFVYAADAQITLPRDPLCACTVNAPPGNRDCGYGADDNCVKKSAFLVLQTLVKELQQELAATKAGIANRHHFK